MKFIYRQYRRLFQKSLQRKYPQYNIGKGTYGNPEVLTWGEGAILEIGAFCSIADGVKIFLGGDHRGDWVTTYPFNILWKSARHIKGHPKTKGNVIIGNDVWIGYGVIIMSGVHIGDGAIIGARAVVTRDVPPYSVAAGNPARIQKQRFDDETTACLLALKWWDWDDKKIEEYLPLLLSNDICAFLDKAEKH